MVEEKSHVGMDLCFLCHEPKGIVLDWRLRNSLPRQACYNKEPCDKCAEWMKQGVILISVRDGESGDNPYRTGGWPVVKDEALRRIVGDSERLDEILKARVCFIDDTTWDLIKLPRKESKPS